MNVPFTVSFVITVDDLVAYIRLMQRTLNRIGVVLGLVIVAMGGLVAIFAQDLVTSVLALFIGVLFIVLAGTEFLDRRRAQRSGRSLIASKATFVFDEDGIKAETVTGSGRVAWDALTKLIYDERVLVIKRDRIPVVWIPRRAFASDDDYVALQAFVQNHLGKRS